MREYKTITQPCEVKLMIKKSVFYGRLYPVESEETGAGYIDTAEKAVLGRNAQLLCYDNRRGQCVYALFR